MIFFLKLTISIFVMIFVTYISFMRIESNENIKKRLKDLERNNFTPMLGALCKFAFYEIIGIFVLCLIWGKIIISTSVWATIGIILLVTSPLIGVVLIEILDEI